MLPCFRQLPTSRRETCDSAPPSQCAVQNFQLSIVERRAVSEARDLNEEMVQRAFAQLHRVLNRCLSMLRLAILASSVCRGIPSFLAAPFEPETRPWDSASAASIICLSRSTSVETRGTLGPDTGDDSCFNHVASTENVSPSQRITAPPKTFCSSRV